MKKCGRRSEAACLQGNGKQCPVRQFGEANRKAWLQFARQEEAQNAQPLKDCLNRFATRGDNHVIVLQRQCRGGLPGNIAQYRAGVMLAIRWRTKANDLCIARGLSNIFDDWYPGRFQRLALRMSDTIGATGDNQRALVRDVASRTIVPGSRHH